MIYVRMVYCTIIVSLGMMEIITRTGLSSAVRPDYDECLVLHGLRGAGAGA
jgi:hypothetical protein